MKSLSTILIFIFLLSCTTYAQEKRNPFEGTTWELTSGKWARDDTTLTFPNSPYGQSVIIFGKSHYSVAIQDTGQNVLASILATYTVEGNSFTATFKMNPQTNTIGESFTSNFQIEGGQLIIKSTDYHLGGYKWKEQHEVWKRID